MTPVFYTKKGLSLSKILHMKYRYIDNDKTVVKDFEMGKKITGWTFGGIINSSSRLSGKMPMIKWMPMIEWITITVVNKPQPVSLVIKKVSAS